ncbi:MAG TPA: DUF6766 family protein [Pyrinomonadaceae bacterium]|jgi:hypothetical protein
MKHFFRNNGLSLVLFALFAFSLVGQYFTGYHEYNEDRSEHRLPAVGYVEYFGEGHFIEAVFENWESEFLQMGMFVLLTVFLFQKGSAESKDPARIELVDVVPADARNQKDAPFPVRRGGWILKLYENSLSLTFFLLFIASFALHAYGSVKDYNLEQLAHGEQPTSFIEYFGTSRFWFESFQNWQSEFLSIGLMVFLSIYLRQKGSPESKPVHAPHDETGKG